MEWGRGRIDECAGVRGTSRVTWVVDLGRWAATAVLSTLNPCLGLTSTLPEPPLVASEFSEFGATHALASFCSQSTSQTYTCSTPFHPSVLGVHGRTRAGSHAKYGSINNTLISVISVSRACFDHHVLRCGCDGQGRGMQERCEVEVLGLLPPISDVYPPSLSLSVKWWQGDWVGGVI